MTKILNSETPKKENKETTFHQETNQCLIKYHGQIIHDNLHGEGVYTQIKPSNNFSYEGTIYANIFEGYGKVIYGNCVYFEGLFKNNQRFGPGVVSHADGSQDVGFWNGTDLMRLAVEVNSDYVPNLAITSLGTLEILKRRKLVPLINHKLNEIENLLENNLLRNPRSQFFNRKYYDKKFNLITSIKTDTKKSKTIMSSLRNIASKVKFEDCTPKELYLLQQKIEILSHLNEDDLFTNSSKNLSVHEVTDILAWNNEDFAVECLYHAFKHRNREHTVNFGTSKIVQKKRNIFNEPGTYEIACKLFLQSCSEGNNSHVLKLHKQYLINPDLTDSKGNSGVIFASARDKVPTIKHLVNLGANINIVNDENINSLNLCLLRYVSVSLAIKDWERAFLLRSDLDLLCNIAENQSWDIFNGQNLQEMVSHSYLSHVASDKSRILNQIDVKENLILHCLNNIVKEEMSLNWFFTKIGIGPNEVPNYQSSYNFPEDTEQKYIFDLSLVQPVKSKRKPPKVDVKKLAQEQADRSEIRNKLEVICDTIHVLLRLGADVNCCDMPVPTIILVLYCNSPRLLEMVIKRNATLTNVYTKNELNLLHILCLLSPRENLGRMGKVLLEKLDINCCLERCSFDHWNEEIAKIEGVAEDFKKPKAKKKSKPDKMSKIEITNDSSTKTPEIAEKRIKPGKTPLHILAARLDFDNDSEGYLNTLATVIAEKNPASLEQLYLGHSPLSLAVLRGNVNLVHALLAAKADPNLELSEGLGNALTIYCLKRYSGSGKHKIIPTTDVCKKILELLVAYGGNPLLPIGNCGNALEFIYQDNTSKLEKSEIIKSEASPKAKGKKSESSKKSAKTAKKSKTSKKSKSSKASEASKKLTQLQELIKYLLELCKEVVLSYCKEKLVIWLFTKIIEGTVQNFKPLFQFLRTVDGIKLIAKFANYNLLNLEDDAQYILASIILECINLYGIKDPGLKNMNKPGKKTKKGSKSPEINKKSAYKTESVKPSASIILSKELTNHDILNACLADKSRNLLPKVTEFSCDQQIYKVCLNCGLRDGKVLIACPKCGLVYFCSQKCNIADAKAKTSQHPCKEIFYQNELIKKEMNNIASVNNLEVTFKNLPLTIPSIKASMNNKIFMDLVNAVKDSTKLGQDATVNKTLDLLGLKLDAKSLNLQRLQPSAHAVNIIPSLSTIFPISYSFIPNNQISVINSFIGTTLTPTSPMDQDTNINFESNSSIHSRASLNGLDFDGVHFNEVATHSSLLNVPNDTMSNNFEENNSLMQEQRFKTIDTGKTYEKKSCRFRSKMNAVESLSCAIILEGNLKQVPYSKPAPRAPHHEDNKFKRESDLKVKRKKTSTGVKQSLTPNQQFVSTLNKLFPEYDFTTAMAPFVCYSDSQFYYKFSDQKPEYFSTHM